MSKGPQRIRGTQDIFGEAADRFQAVVAAFERVRRLYAFRHIEVPVFEATEVFARSIGETTDIVAKEMYTFEDRGGDSITLRPEFTAGICRAYISNGWQQHAPLKLATHGPVFRYERPQKGRYRQFHQLDAEIIGTDAPAADVELLVLADQLLKELGITEGVTLQLNTLGDEETRGSWRSALVLHFEAHKAELSEESQDRLCKNPLRILDSKDPRDRPIIEAAPAIDMYFTSDAAAFLDEVERGLRAAGVRFQRNPRLVRGLDYYRHTAFEFVTDLLGAQGAVIAGGRYDGLIESLGGPPTRAVGWAAGIERLADLLELCDADRPDLALVDESMRSQEALTRVAAGLRRAGISFVGPFQGKPKRQFELAQKARVKARLNLRRWEPNDTLSEESLAADDPVIAQVRYAVDSVIDVDLTRRIYEVLGEIFDTRFAVGSDDVILLREKTL